MKKWLVELYIPFPIAIVMTIIMVMGIFIGYDHWGPIGSGLGIIFSFSTCLLLITCGNYTWQKMKTQFCQDEKDD